ncbi:MAG TPA: hypothetical protein VN517_06285 [Terriglobales bacterium]|nr:hypothetical protein [Terriglobales bacterium]
MCELTEAADKGQYPKISRKKLTINFLGRTDKIRNWRGFPGIPASVIAEEFRDDSPVPEPSYSNYESAWTWDIFLLSTLDEMVSASY